MWVQTGMEPPNSFWSDPLYFQFDKMMPALAHSLGRLNSRISTLAVTDLDFSPSLGASFRKVATAKLFGQLLMENPRLKLIKCTECNMVRSELRGGILTVSRGLADQEQRKKLATKLGVEGFMSAMIIEDQRQLTIVINVYDAQEGRIILSDVVAGIPTPKNDYYNVYAGKLTIPVKLSTGSNLDHSVMMVGVERSLRFSESAMLGANFAAFMDNNSKLASGHETFTPGFMFDGIVGYELAFANNNAAFTGILGMGQFISTQFNFAIYYKYGVKITIGQLLTFNIFGYTFDETNLEASSSGSAVSTLPGSATSMAFGFQF